MPKWCTTLKPETLLRRLASDGRVKGETRLRAIELLMHLQGKLKLNQVENIPANPKENELATLIPKQAAENKKDIANDAKAA